MAIQAIAAPTIVMADAQLSAGVGVPIIASAGTALDGKSGFTLAWVPGLILYFLAASGNSNTLAFTQVVPCRPPTTGTLAEGVAYYFGPIGISFVNQFRNLPYR